MNLTRWLDKVPALVDSWYPGQEGGTAVAQVLFGKHNPEGHLPVSWDRTWKMTQAQSGTTATPPKTPP